MLKEDCASNIRCSYTSRSFFISSASAYQKPLSSPVITEGTPLHNPYWEYSRNKATCEAISGFPKYYYKRKRPFVRFQEPTATPEFEPELRRNFSYPSGHTILGWASALLLTEINPERADTILARGMMYGESRVIVGAHWQSDVDAGRLAAAAAYARMHTSDRFLEQMRRARQEFQKKRK